MDVEVQVRYFLERCLPDRVPKAETLVRESGTDRSGDAREGIHESGASIEIEVAHVAKMHSRDDERVPSMKLP
jgi:hypothetical protein